MAAWWTYSLSDFLLFAPRTYYRLFELANEALWPAHIAALVLAGAILGLARRGGAGPARLAPALLAFAWLFVAWAFLGERYATINWAAEYMAWGFALQALALGAAAVQRAPVKPAPPRAIGLGAQAIVFFAVFLYPLMAPLLGRPSRQAEIFGIAPDPTAAATLGVALLAPARTMWLLLPLPLLWCLVSGATLWTMKAPDAALLPALGLLALGLAIAKSRARGRVVRATVKAPAGPPL